MAMLGSPFQQNARMFKGLSMAKEGTMNAQIWKRAAMVVALLAATQACAVFIDDDDDYRRRGYGHRHHWHQEWHR